METITGIPASKGIAIGPGWIYLPKSLSIKRTQVADAQAELERLHAALEVAYQELEGIYQNALASVGSEQAEIFRAHQLMLQDPDLLETVEQQITDEHTNAEAAFHDAAEGYAQTLEGLADAYLSARAADIRDVSARVVRILQRQSQETHLDHPVIVLAEDLTPSDTMQFERAYLLGFCTAGGGTTSHTAILARALGIPAVVGTGRLPENLPENSCLILDGEAGRLLIDPDAATLEDYRQRQQEQAARDQQERQSALEHAITRDHKQVEVVANIGSLEDAARANANGAEGVGLFRTEFSYLERTYIPGEEEMYQDYAAILRTFGDRPVILRTLDIGGDKEIPHLNLPVEQNPFLGTRGIRLCFERPELFKPQLRAALRAGYGMNLCIMFPMIATPGEVRQARAILDACIAELARENLPHNAHPKVGIMIEVPAAVFCADQLAKEVDFFSIGTNDLTQYTMAADRTNASLANLVSALQPAVLRAIKLVIDYAHHGGIWVGMCGELAGQPLAIPILLGLGLDEFSMNPPAIPAAKTIIRAWDTAQAAELARRALQCETPEAVETLVREWRLPAEGS